VTASVESAHARFLDGFETEAGALDRSILALYRAHERLRKAVRVARTLRPDGDEKAARRLRSALATVEEPS
jgi:hypothetical protein